MKSLLSESQKQFLFNNTIKQVVEEDSCTFTFIKDLLDIESPNTPLNEPILLVTLFEFINCFLYLVSPSKIVNSKNKEGKIINFYNYCYKNFYGLPKLEKTKALVNIESLTSNKLVIKYRVNPFKLNLDVTIFIGALNFNFDYDLKYFPSIYSFSIQYKIEDSIELLYKIIDIYRELIQVMPDEDLAV